MKKTVLTLALITLTLTGCSGNPVEKIENYLQNNEFEDAMEWLADEIEDEPESPLLHALATEVILKECAQTNCFDEKPEKLESLALHLSKIKKSEIIIDEKVVNLHDRVINVAKDLIKSKHHPKALTSINFFMPYGNLMKKFSILTFKTASDHIIAGDIPPASTLMESLSKKLILKNPNQAIATLLNGYITNDNDSIKKALANFKKTDNATPVNDDAIIALPYAIFQQIIEREPNTGTEIFLKEFRNVLNAANISYLSTDRGQAKIANAVYAMSRNKHFLDRASLHTSTKINVTKGVEQEQEKEKSMHKLELMFVKLALLTNPRNQKSWDIFLEPAAAYAIETGDAQILFEGLEPGDIPSGMITEYNAALFHISEKLVEENNSILNIIQHIILPAEGAEFVKNKVSKLLNQAMITAVDTANYDLVYKYASFQPDIARLSRQKVVSITIEALEKKWKKNDFDGMDKLAEFLHKTMGIDFSLDSLLLQSFDDFLTQTGVQKQLNALSSNSLLLSSKDAKINLGDKFTFLQKHFSKQPDVLDNLLKSLIVKSEGTYGTPVALHKLSTYFSDKFPEEDRSAYLINAIKNSLSKDDELSALEFATQGQKLQAKYSEIAQSFIIDETLKRVKTLSDSKELWAKSGEKFKTLLIDTQPQFSTLMKAITAYDKGDHERAASMFTILSDVNLIEQARPYLQEYVETVHAQVGVYALNKKDSPESVHTKMLYIDLIESEEKLGKLDDDNKPITDKKTDLLAVKITLISRLGSIKSQSPKDLTVDFGKVARYEIIGRINPNTMEITIPEDQKSGQGLPLSFEKIFGNLTKLSLQGNRIIYVAGKDECTFKRINNYSTTEANFPDGKFSITKSDEKNDERSRHVMPVGSIVEIKVNQNRPITPRKNGRELTTIYPVKGFIHHPSSEKPRPLEGFYNPDKEIVSFGYTYPLINGGTLDAVIRCQTAGVNITCAGHNKHWGRQRYSYIVTGVKVLTPEAPKKNKINRVKSRSPRN